MLLSKRIGFNKRKWHLFQPTSVWNGIGVWRSSVGFGVIDEHLRWGIFHTLERLQWGGKITNHKTKNPKHCRFELLFYLPIYFPISFETFFCLPVLPILCWTSCLYKMGGKTFFPSLPNSLNPLQQIYWNWLARFDVVLRGFTHHPLSRQLKWQVIPA